MFSSPLEYAKKNHVGEHEVAQGVSAAVFKLILVYIHSSMFFYIVLMLCAKPFSLVFKIIKRMNMLYKLSNFYKMLKNSDLCFPI